MCNKRIILHIGPPKTGTSALQYFFVRNKKILENAGIDYTDFWLRFRNIIRELCGESTIIDIVTYLRRQDERCVSAWKERIRGTYHESV